MIGGVRPLLRKNLADTDPPADILSIFARIASAVTRSKKVKLTLTGSSLRAFQ